MNHARFRAAAGCCLLLGILGCGPNGSGGEAPGTDTLHAEADTDTSLAADTLQGPLAAGLGTWTVGRVATEPGSRTAILRTVRSARHDSFDRLTFEFAQGLLPGLDISYVDQPVIDCATGEPIAVVGDGYLEVRFLQARSDLADTSPRHLSMQNVERLTLTCTEDGELRWLLDVRSPEAFRVQRLSSPTRYALDVIALPPAPPSPDR